MGRKKLYSTPDELREHQRIYSKKYRADNADKIKKNYDKAKKKVYYLTNLNKIKANKKVYYLANVNKIKAYLETYRAANLDKIKVARKAYLADNVDKIKVVRKAYRANNADKIKTYNKAYQAANLDKINSYVKNRRKTNIQYKLSIRLRGRLNKALKSYKKTGSAVKDLGCTVDELKTHLESKFQSGMTWDNWSREGWHIDHIKPLASFDLTDREQLLIACHYTNLQPLWAKDNIAKGNKIISYNV